MQITPGRSQEQSYDIVIVGGGIHGAGVAQAAAARGHSVLVLERDNLACGTSSRSSKLIHGGLRYLETAQFSLVHECLRERALLLKLAPDLVKLHPFYIPIYPETTRRPWQLRLGLSLYSMLGGLSAASRYRHISPRQWDNPDGLETRNLTQIFQYWDAQTDDAALTRAVMKSAESMGACLVMPATFDSARLNTDGCEVQYLREGQACTCACHALVNAAGPWVNPVLESITPQPARLAMDLVQGSHIVIDGTLSKGFYYLEAPQDKRAVFAMPWSGKILVGTTEKMFHGDPATVAPTGEEIQYLLNTFGHYFPAFRYLQPDQVSASFAGLRVLPSDSKQPFRRSRETILHLDRLAQPRVLTIYGGKLTTYRATAEKIMRQLENSLPVRAHIADTRRIPLFRCRTVR